MISDDLKVLKQAKPYIRSICAFLLYLRYGDEPSEECYVRADIFLKQLERDVKKNG